jgi:hypothetical protein
MMFEALALSNFIGKPMFYNDKETGIGWDIEVFDVYKSADTASTRIIITDNIVVEISPLEMVMGQKTVLKKIHAEYAKQIGELNG